MNYTSREVVRRLKQYDMFLNSINLINDPLQKERICDQLDKIEKQILLETNAEYEENYMLLLGKNTRFFEEEKNRLHELINLVIDRREYLERRKIKHKNITGSLVELTTFLGEDKLNVFKNRLKIIEKYEENKLKQEKLIKEIKSLDIKISEASRSVKANTRLNESLENKMISLVSRALDKLNYYSLVDKKEELLKKYETLKYALELAKDNLKASKELAKSDAIIECDNMLSQINMEYSSIHIKVNILRLIDIYDKKVSSYDELLTKREEMDDIIKNIVGSELYREISTEIDKQYNTIKLEKHDVENYEAIKAERDNKNKMLYEMEEENNSREFKLVLDELIKNENRHRESELRAARQKEQEERQKKLIEEQKLEASRIRRQKLIEEARLKEQSKIAESLKKQQEKTSLNVNKEKPKLEEKPKEIKPLDSILSTSDDFDTDELFENSRVVPNKVLGKDSIIRKPIIKEDKMPDLILPPISDFDKKEEIEMPSLWQQEVTNNKNTVVDLFKENQAKREALEVKEQPKEEKEVTSIYDILENNDNIIWKSTETKVNDSSTIPVIGNNNLKPEVLEKEKVNKIGFPNLGSKDGDILWKETL